MPSGGKRKGAGRPPKKEKEKHKAISITLEQRQIKLLQGWAKKDAGTVSSVCREMIDGWYVKRRQK